MVCHGERWFGESWQRRVIYGPESRASYDTLLYEGNCISTSAVVVRRDKLTELGGFCEDRSIVTAEDYDLWLRLARDGLRIGFLPKVLGDYRIHGGNQSGAVLRNIDATREVVRRHIEARADNTFRGRLRARRRMGILDYSCGRGYQDSGHHQEAWPWFLRSLAAWPFLARCYIALGLNAIGRRVRQAD
jgi:GT2 family glycosyltransferase